MKIGFYNILIFHSQIQLAYGMPMQVPFPYFYPPNGSKSQHFSTPLSSTSDTKAFNKNNNNASSSENSSSPINFSSRTEGYTGDFQPDGLRQRSMSTEEKNRAHGDDENVEVD